MRLYEAKGAQLLLYGRALGLSHGEAEDLLQETFVHLLKVAEIPEEPEFYLLRSFRNRALNHKRTLWRRIRRELESARWFERSPEGNPQEEAAMACLARLPTEQREAVVLKIWHDHTFEEIGLLLGISPHTVAGRYRYGMQKMKHCLKGNIYEKRGADGSHDEGMDPTRALAGRGSELVFEGQRTPGLC